MKIDVSKVIDELIVVEMKFEFTTLTMSTWDLCRSCIYWAIIWEHENRCFRGDWCAKCSRVEVYFWIYNIDYECMKSLFDWDNC